jgi:hypothetical protein
MSESTNQLCGTVRGRRLTDAELIRVVHRILTGEGKPVYSHTIYTNVADNTQEAHITSSNHDQA